MASPVAAVVESLLVKPGQRVQQGTPLASLSGAEVALARTEVRKCEAEERIVQIKDEWTRQTHNNLAELLVTLRERPTMAEVETKFRGRSLGQYRDQLLTAYARYLLTSDAANRARPLGEQGIVSGSTLATRSSDRDVAATEFITACEILDYESRRELAKSAAELDVARQQLAVSQERLRLLLGPFADTSTYEARADFQLHAPFDGCVEALHVAPASRVAQADPLLTFADTTDLWVAAMVHQHEWEVLKLAANQTIQVSLPAFPDEVFAAQMSFVGPEVSASTRAISLIARLENSRGRFRPGMFAWVSLPSGPPRQALAVHPSSVQRVASETFVFVEETARSFQRTDVTIGLETPEYVEVTSGLAPGQRVVDQGAFYLKSELLLEQEAE
jgi:RND family efflux transporter MFP subunit